MLLGIEAKKTKNFIVFISSFGFYYLKFILFYLNYLLLALPSSSTGGSYLEVIVGPPDELGRGE